MTSGNRGISLLAIAAAIVMTASSGLAETLEEKVHSFELKNGMKWLVVERHEAPVAFMAIVFNVGSANEWPNVTGISHLLEHMMFKGTRTMGTRNHKAEIPYIEKTDALGARTIALRAEIGEWRMERFESLRREIMASFSEADNEAVGTDKALQNDLVAARIRGLEEVPDDYVNAPGLVEDRGRNYLNMYLEYLETWAEKIRLIEEQRERYVINNELWETYMNNGGRMLNAATSQDFTLYFVYLPANRLELWMTMESDRMDTPVFREFWIERDVVMEERRLAENNPDRMLDEAFNAAAFAASPYRWPVLGWMSDLRSIDRHVLADFHRRFYAPNNATACVVGAVDAGLVERMANRYFASIPAQDPPPQVLTREPRQRGERRVIVEDEASPSLKIGWHKPSYPHPDAAVFEVISSVLSGGRTSRLYRTVYEEQQLTARPPSAYTGPGNRYDNLLILQADPRHPHSPDEVEEALLEQIEALKTEPLSGRELKRVKNQIDAQQIRQLGSNLGIAFSVMMGELVMGDFREMFRYYDQVKDVTADDVMRVSREYLTPQTRTVAHRVQVEPEPKDEPENDGSADFEKHRAVVMQYIQSLPQNEQMQILQRFQSLRSEQEQRAFATELLERAREAGFIKD